jgi:nucleotide-binding universal stress UspA family protein
MFRHLLVPIDGSPAALQAVKVAARFARTQRARMTAFWVGPNWEPGLYAYGDAVPHGYVSQRQHAAHVRRAARRHLGAARRVAASARARCRTEYVEGTSPYQEIVNAAKRFRCDLIIMASHSRGLSRLLLGSQTSKALAHAAVPVMVVRAR